MTVDEAAERVGLSAQRIRALIASDRLAAERVGSRYVIQREDVASFLQQERAEGRPLSSRNAWALLAQISGRAEAVKASRRSLYRLRRLLKEDGATVRALSHAEPRSSVHSWRVLPSDIKKLKEDSRLVPSGLAADDAQIDVRYQPKRDGFDAYVSAPMLKSLERQLRPIKKSDEPNLVLRVPRASSWVLKEKQAPSAVVAADLLDHRDPRVSRAARASLMSSVHSD